MSHTYLCHEPRHTRRCACVAAALAAMATATPLVHAAETTLAPVVVTGTRTEKPLLDSPVRTQVVSAADLERTHARDLQQALRHVPGITLTAIHGKSGKEVSLQGLDGDRVLVLIDGQPVAASTGSTVDLSQIAVHDVQRIEIVKGATSALYGSEAMGGVVNVITREPDGDAYHVTLDAGGYGDHNRSDRAIAKQHVAAGWQKVTGPWVMSLDADYRATDGFDLDDTSYNAEGEDGDRANVAARLAYRWSDGRELELAPRYYHEDIATPFSSTAPGQGEIRKSDEETAERWHTALHYRHPLTDGGLLTTSLVHERFTDDTRQDALATPVLDQSRKAEIELHQWEGQWDQPIGDRHLVTAGLAASRETLAQSQHRIEGGSDVHVPEIEPGADRRTAEGFIQDDIFLGERWELLPGVRYQHDDDFGGFLAPKINLMYRRELTGGARLNLRAGYGKGYRVPNLKERFYVFDHSALGYVVLGNPDLQPEQSDSLQLGAEIVTEQARLDVNLFHNRLDDLITTALDPERTAESEVAVYRYTNLEQARTQGAEFVAEYRPTAAWAFSGGYTYLDTENERTGKQLPGRARHQVNVEATYHHRSSGLAVSVLGTYRSEEYADANNNARSPNWTRWDVRVNQPVNERLTVFAGIDNLTNEHRAPGVGTDRRPLEPRFAYLGLRYAL